MLSVLFISVTGLIPNPGPSWRRNRRVNNQSSIQIQKVLSVSYRKVQIPGGIPWLTSSAKWDRGEYSESSMKTSIQENNSNMVQKYVTSTRSGPPEIRVWNVPYCFKTPGSKICYSILKTFNKKDTVIVLLKYPRMSLNQTIAESLSFFKIVLYIFVCFKHCFIFGKKISTRLQFHIPSTLHNRS